MSDAPSFPLIFSIGPLCLPLLPLSTRLRVQNCRVSNSSLMGITSRIPRYLSHSRVNACEMPRMIPQNHLQRRLCALSPENNSHFLGRRPGNTQCTTKITMANILQISPHVAMAVPDDSRPVLSLFALASAASTNPGRYLDRYLPAIGLASSTNRG